jgi:DNA-binding MarR family transcriptional regulator
MPVGERTPKTAADSLPELGDVLEFMRVIWQLDHALQRTSKLMEKSLGMTGPQRLVIRIVGRFPEIPAGELARLLHLHPSTITGILKRLEEQGLLHRSSDAQDGRRALLRLTERGRLFDVAASGTVEACVAKALKTARPGQSWAAKELLSGIAERLTASCAAAVAPVSIAKRQRPRRRR